MKWTIGLSAILLFACHNSEHKRTTIATDTSLTNTEATHAIKETKPETVLPKQYANERFREVTVERTGENKFHIQGRGQLFEANFNWIVTDGHQELKQGFQMTDAGAPEWGRFDFTIEIQKKREKSTLTLILFETSANDGSRQYELPLVLY